MSRHVHLAPGDADPRTIDPDAGTPLAQPLLNAGATAALAAGPQYRPLRCYRASDQQFVGYLSTRGSQSAAVGTGDDYPPAMCYWWETGGAVYLAKQTSPYDRCLGLGDSGYASWALQQARNMGYFTNVIHNPDGTISPGVYPNTYLAGPYEKYGINWVWWAPKGHPDILVCELEIGSAPTWQNWSGNLKHLAASDGANYYFTPRNLLQLKLVLAEAKQKGVTVRVSGQRHSQSPLVADDNRQHQPAHSNAFLVDMSCYVDVGTSGIALGPGNNQVTVNAGIREDAVDAFLTQHNLMFKTVTAGGFFSVGGMTAVDVHGGTVDAPIFAETASSFTILGADGNLSLIDAASASVNGWSPLQFARVSLGGLGVVTSMTFDVLPRPYATSVKGETKRVLLKDKAAFVSAFQQMLSGPAKYERMEVFYTPYAAAPNVPFPALPNFLVLGYNSVAHPEPKTPNGCPDPTTACILAGAGEFGAPMLGGLKGYAAEFVRNSQYFSNPYNPLHVPPIPTAGFTALALDEIESQAATANLAHSDLWLAESSQVMFMSYFIELPDLGAQGLGKVWDGLDLVARRVILDDHFHIAAPMEFRFVKGGNSAMSGSYSSKPNAYFINLDLIGFIEPTPSADYPAKMLQFFADVEREWVAMGGFPHNGKMYGFYDPDQPAGTHSAAFNPNFIANLRQRRGERLQAFSNFRRERDPGNLFYNDFLRQLLEG